MFTWLLVALIVLLLLAAVPAWPYSRGWGWGPSGILGFLLLVLIIALIIGAI